jgi:hypothetical protein
MLKIQVLGLLEWMGTDVKERDLSTSGSRMADGPLADPLYILSANCLACTYVRPR